MKVFELLRLPEPIEGEVGIEVEVECQNSYPRPTRMYWSLVDDGSLRGYSGEYVLKKPCTRGQVNKILNHLRGAFIKDDIQVKDSFRAGVHVHINCQEMTLEQVRTFCTLYYLFENLLLEYCGKDRSGNLFCLGAKNADYVLDFITSAFLGGDIKDFNADIIRYTALNLSSLPKYGSVEFRALGTHPTLEGLETWVGLLLALKDYSLSLDNSINVIEQFSHLGALALTETVFGELAPLLSDQPDFNQNILAGMWTAQDLAFNAMPGEGVMEVERNEKYEAIKARRKKPIVWDDR